MPKPIAFALQLKSKTLNFKFQTPHNFLPAVRFSLILKFRQCRLILKSVPHTRCCWLKSNLSKITTITFTKPKPKPELFSSEGIQKVAISVILYFVNVMFACRTRYKLLCILFIVIVSFWILLNFNDSRSPMSCIWWFATSFIDLMDILSKISAAMADWVQ